jgi:hypothetical protein
MTLRIEDDGESGPDGSAIGLLVTVSAAPSTDERKKSAMKAKFELLRRELRAQFTDSKERLGGIDSLAKAMGHKASTVREVANVVLDEGELEATGTSNNTKGFRYVGT